MADERKRLTVPDLKTRKKANEKVVMVSIPDYPSAVWAERAGIDIAAVGDSLGMVVQGLTTTIPVSMDEMAYHCRCVARGHSDRGHCRQDDQRCDRRQPADAGHRIIDALALYGEDGDHGEVHDPRRGQATPGHHP